jgi:outer membrane lipoprotein-sorting protein
MDCREAFSTEKYTSSLSGLGTTGRTVVNKANAYFRNIKTIKSDFYQSNGPGQNDSWGTFQISRPGKLKFEYISPPKSLFISNGGVINYYDQELDEISVLPASKIPLVFLLDNGQSLENLDSDILGVTCSRESCIIITEVIEDEMDYRIEYIFDKKVENLLEIAIMVDDDQRISLKLVNTEINLNIDEKVFVFRNPRVYRNRK